MAINKKEYNRKYYHEVRKKKNKFETELQSRKEFGDFLKDKELLKEYKHSRSLSRRIGVIDSKAQLNIDKRVVLLDINLLISLYQTMLTFLKDSNVSTKTALDLELRNGVIHPEKEISIAYRTNHYSGARLFITKIRDQYMHIDRRICERDIRENIAIYKEKRKALKEEIAKEVSKIPAPKVEEFSDDEKKAILEKYSFSKSRMETYLTKGAEENYVDDLLYKEDLKFFIKKINDILVYLKDGDFGKLRIQDLKTITHTVAEQKSYGTAKEFTNLNNVLKFEILNKKEYGKDLRALLKLAKLSLDSMSTEPPTKAGAL